MAAFTDLTGLLAGALLIGVATLQLPFIRRLPRCYLALFTTSILLLCLIPFNGLPLAGYVRGIVGDLSITTVVLMLINFLQPYRLLFDSKQHSHLFIVVVLAAVCLYPWALGIGLFDPYRLGYSDMLFISTILLFAIAALLVRENLLALCLILATLAWSIGWYESNNLWDYLLDPLVVVYALLLLLSRRIHSAN